MFAYEIHCRYRDVLCVSVRERNKSDKEKNHKANVHISIRSIYKTRGKTSSKRIKKKPANGYRSFAQAIYAYIVASLSTRCHLTFCYVINLFETQTYPQFHIQWSTYTIRTSVCLCMLGLACCACAFICWRWKSFE